MARPRVHSDDEILDGARDLVLDGGARATSIRAIAERSRAPSGTLYHRFGSRDAVIAETWLRAVTRFQAGFLEGLNLTEPMRAGVAAAVWTYDFARAEPRDARLLLGHGQQDLLDRCSSPELRAQLETVNRPVVDAVMGLAGQLCENTDARSHERVTFAVVDLPYAVVRRHLLAGHLPKSVREDLASATRTLLEHLC